MKKLSFFAVCLLSSTVITGCHSKTTDEVVSETAAPVAVEVSTAALRPIETTIVAQGILTPAPNALSRVAAPSAAKLTEVLVREGDRVSVGQLIARTDGRAAQAASQSASAALTSSLADAKSAMLSVQAAQSDESNAVRQAALALKTAVTEGNNAIINAHNALRAAQSDLRKARLGAQVSDVTSALRAAKLAYQAAKIDRESSIASAQNAVRSAQTDLDKVRAGARPQEISAARTAVTQASATKDRAQTEVDRVQFLFQKGIKAKRELDDAQTALSVAQAGVQTAQDNLNLLLAGARPEDLQAAQLTVQGAQSTLDAARQSGDAKLSSAQNDVQTAQTNLRLAQGSRPEDVKSAQLKTQAAQQALAQAQSTSKQTLAAAQSNLQAARAAIIQISAKNQDAQSKIAAVRGKQADLQSARVNESSAEIRAPLSGIVSKRLLNAGDMADPSTPILEISDASALVMEAQIPAESGSIIRPGMRAVLRAESSPDRAFSAAVQSVGQVDPQSGLLEVRVLVSNPGGALKIGALASCEITTARRPLAVTIPKSALLTRDGASIVIVADGDVAHQKDVTAGAQNGDFLEIRRGLKPGERVVRVGQYELEDGAKIKVTSG